MTVGLPPYAEEWYPLVRDEVERYGARPCSKCGGTYYRLSHRRFVACLQCMGCGKPRDEVLKATNHRHPGRYFCFDEDLWNDGLGRPHFGGGPKDAALDYQRWLLESREWRQLSRRVRERAGTQCEACLERPATEVHHLTYRLGRLPPAWLLKAVCRECHDRFKAADDEWNPGAGKASAR